MSAIYNFICLNIYGDRITQLTQWDTNQVLKVENLNVSSAPIFHFCTEKTDQALVVQSKFDSNNIVTVDVPNILLQENYKIYVYIYMYENSVGTTVGVIRLPVQKKAKPASYIYVENIEYVQLTDLIATVSDLEKAIQTQITNAKTATTNAEKATNDAKQVISDGKSAIDDLQNQLKITIAETAKTEQAVSDAKDVVVEAKKAIALMIGTQAIGIQTPQQRAFCFNEVSGGSPQSRYSSANYTLEFKAGTPAERLNSH